MKTKLQGFKKVKTFILFLCLSVSISKAQYVTIPDPHFAAYIDSLIPASINGNQLDTTSQELSSITFLTIGTTSDSVENLEGIQYFSALTNLSCGGLLTTIPALPRNLQYFDSEGNSNLTTILSLPNSLIGFNCSDTKITSLPPLPNSLIYLTCNGNSLLTSLPALPPSLNELHCNYSQITTFPTLPPTLKVLSCVGGTATSLPALPNTLSWLNISECHLTSLPVLPYSLVELECDGNNISCFEPFSTNIHTLNISNNPFNCLPNYTSAMDANTIAYPLCSSGNTNGCAVANGCTPVVFFSLNKDTFQVGTWYVNPFYSAQTTSVKWYWGDGTSTLGLYPSHTYASPGTYNICVTLFASCGDSASYCQNDSIYRLANNSAYNSMVQVTVMNGSPAAGISKSVSVNNQVAVYPNPSNGELTIASTSNIDNIKVTNMLGQTVYEAKPLAEKTTLQLNNAGVYFVTTTSGKEISTKKIIVSK